MRILVTGGAGFIGSHLVDELLRKGYEVFIVDNLSTGKKENINSKANFYKSDIRKPNLGKIFAEVKPDYVFHFAAQIDVRKSVSNPLFDAENNISGTINLLERCKEFKVKKVIFASSGGVIYGEKRDLPAIEDMVPNPFSPYGISKLCCEYYMKYYSLWHGMNCTSLRFSNVYGPRQNPYGEAGVVAIFIRNILNGEKPSIFGDGEQIRDYLLVNDAVSASISCIEKGDNEIFNIGTGVPTSVNRLFKILKSNLNFEGEPEYKPKRPGELYKNYLNCEKAKKEIDFKPQVSLEYGIRYTIEWFKKEKW